MTDRQQLLEKARRAHAERDWPTARQIYLQAAQQSELPATDRRNLADTAWWLGLIDEAINGFEAAALQHHKDGNNQDAAMASSEAAVSYFLRGDESAGTAWIERAVRWLEGEPECLTSGWIALFTQVEAQIAQGNLGEADTAAIEVARIGREFSDNSLVAVATVCRGRIALKQGRVIDGMGSLDEALLMAMQDNLEPAISGNIYCEMMSACYELGDLQRMDHWLEQTKAWCERLPAAVLFRGICRVHQAQLLGIHGSWAQAEAEALRVCEELAEISVSNVAEAQYSLGEVSRLRGDFVNAERAYREAHQRGREPQPGFALLRLAQGRVGEAAASIRTSLSTCSSRLMRARLLFAQCEIALAADDTETSAQDVAELADIAQQYGTAGLRAMSLQAYGSHLVAVGRANEALAPLRDACLQWQTMGAPHACAGVRLWLARALRELGDEGTAALEEDVAKQTFAQLQADQSPDETAAPNAHGLSDREIEVLVLVAEGCTNRDVATALFISEKTVARHVSNIFVKLGVTSRTAAAAYAHTQKLVRPIDG